MNKTPSSRPRTPATVPYDAIKRAIDIAGSCAGLVATLPVQGVVAALIARKLGRPVVFSQARPGKDGRIFTLYKFRTMAEVDPARGLVTDEQRLTPFGAMLRSTSLDELPSLWNVLKGDMSLVGPRPLLVRYLERYTPEQARRHEVRPGITGLAQVSGRNALSWEDKFALDVRYVEQRSLLLDLRILLKTVAKTVRRSGITSPTSATMEEFQGTGQTPGPSGGDLPPGRS